jgi:hypothetical protein
MSTHEVEVREADKVACTCDPCKRKRHDAHSVRPCTVHAYTSQPAGGWRVRRTSGERDAFVGAPAFGIELETAVAEADIRQLPGRPQMPYLPWNATAAETRAYNAAATRYDLWERRNRAHVQAQREAWALDNLTDEEAVSVAAPVGFWHPKHDGSVSGPEFVSHPATLAYWRSIRPDVERMFLALTHGGLRGHDTRYSCSMHVNMGTSAFADAGHLERFARLVAEKSANRRWATRMAQRTHEQVLSWAQLDTSLYTSAQRRAAWADEVMTHGESYTSHTAALNTSHRGRIEFRVPRANLNPRRFYAKLEWVAAMVEFTRDAHNAPKPAAFCEWAEAREAEYPDLLWHMRDRFPRRFDEAPAVE